MTLYHKKNCNFLLVYHQSIETCNSFKTSTQTCRVRAIFSHLVRRQRRTGRSSKSTATSQIIFYSLIQIIYLIIHRFRNLELLYTIKAEVSQRRQLRSLDDAYFGSSDVSLHHNKIRILFTRSIFPPM